MKNNNLDLKKTISYPDHYNFTKSELEKIVDISKRDNLEILTTEKDFYRIKDFKIEQIKCFKIELEILNNRKFISQIIKNI